jgi:NADH-quinone oxidoreductase subunit N
LALGFTVLLLAHAGIPFTSGFIAKFGVIQAAVEVESYALAVIAMVCAVIAAFLYLRIMVSMWVGDSTGDASAGDAAEGKVAVPFSMGVVITLSVAFTLVLGVLPGWLIDAADQVTQYAR